jgi:hypothetical protein
MMRPRTDLNNPHSLTYPQQPQYHPLPGNTAAISFTVSGMKATRKILWTQRSRSCS